MLGLHCCMWSFSSSRQQGLVSRCGAWAAHCNGFTCCRAQALGTWASAVVAHRFISCGAWSWLLCSMGSLPGSRVKLVSPELADRFLSTATPGSLELLFYIEDFPKAMSVGWRRTLASLSHRFYKVKYIMPQWRLAVCFM